MTAYLTDGFHTYYGFGDYPSILFKEISVTPPGVDNGGAVDITTMRNTTWRTMNAKQLKTLTESKATVAYDPAVLDNIVAMCGQNQLITITFSDGSNWVFWGFLNNFTPGEATEGQRPTAEVTIVPTNHDNSGAEVAPVYNAA